MLPPFAGDDSFRFACQRCCMIVAVMPARYVRDQTVPISICSTYVCHSRRQSLSAPLSRTYSPCATGCQIGLLTSARTQAQADVSVECERRRLVRARAGSIGEDIIAGQELHSSLFAVPNAREHTAERTGDEGGE